MISRTRPRTSIGWYRKAEEDRTIPTCRPALGALAALLALPFQAAEASVEDRAALAAYVRARAADSIGSSDKAARDYAAALSFAPQNELLAARALSRALAAGDRSLALRAARSLEAAGKLAPDGRLLLLTEALRNRDWRAATSQIDRIEKDEVFSFMAPMLRAWVAYGSRKGDPLALLGKAVEHPLAAVYAAEHRPLLLLARGRLREGLAALTPVLAEDERRAVRLRIAGAAVLSRKGRRGEALALLAGEGRVVAAARARLEAGRPLPGAVDGASEGVAELLLRMALDLNGQDVPQLALSFARLATFLAPGAGEAWLVTSELLAAQGEHRSALAALGRIDADDPTAALAAERRIALLVDSGRKEEALSEARAAAVAEPAAVDRWAQLGDLLTGMKRHREAAEAYRQALSVPGGGADHPQWALWLLAGSALTQSGDWAAARAALEHAYKLAPQQAVVLNFLGYSQLERRENLAEAERLIREASKLQPDDPAITDSLGWVHYVRGDVPEAIELLERAARGEPADAAINEHLGDAYYSAGRRFEARYAWKAALTYAEGDAATRLQAKIAAGLTPELAAP